MRRFLLMLIATTLFPGRLGADAYKEHRSGIEFPDAVGHYKRGEITPYEAEPGKRGVAIEYRAEDAEITIYVRSLGNELSKTSADFLKENIAAIKELERRGQYSNVKIYEFSPDKETPGWKTAAFTSTSANRFLISFICCKVIPGNFVKIRASTGNPKNEAMQSFIKSVQGIVDGTSKK